MEEKVKHEQVLSEKYRLLSLLDNATTEEEHDIINDSLGKIQVWLMFN
jgi:hypothetical protein